MDYFYIFILVVSTFSLGFDFFYNNSFNKGMIYSLSSQKQIPMKFVLSASLKTFLFVKILLIVAPLAFILIILLLQLRISILYWISLFVCIFNGMYFIGYLYPKIKRMIHWDIKNPIHKWESLYKSYNQSSEILLIISLINFIIILIAFLNESLKII